MNHTQATIDGVRALKESQDAEFKRRLKPIINTAVCRGLEVEECKRVIGDDRTRTIESNARANADRGNFDLPGDTWSGSHWNQVKNEMERVIYLTAHGKRLERIERMKNKR